MVEATCPDGFPFEQAMFDLLHFPAIHSARGIVFRPIARPEELFQMRVVTFQVGALGNRIDRRGR